MNWHYAVIGTAVLLVVTIDFMLTTIGSNRTGKLTHFVARKIWRGLQLVYQAYPVNLLHYVSGPIVMTAITVFWISSTSAAWLLIFRSDPLALVLQDTGVAAGWLQSYAYVGSALSTAGASNASASSAVWDNLAMLAAVNGMVVLTLSVSFILNVTQTVVAGRTLTILLSSVDPTSQRGLDIVLPNLADQCARLRATPYALFFSSTRANRRVPMVLAELAQKLCRDGDIYRTCRPAFAELPSLDLPDTSDPNDESAEIQAWAQRYLLN